MAEGKGTIKIDYARLLNYTDIEMDASGTWIVPYIGEELIDVTRVKCIAVERWKYDHWNLFASTLCRSTNGLVNRNDPLIREYLSKIWQRNVNNTAGLDPRYIQIAISHGFHQIISFIHAKGRTHCMSMNDVTFHERYYPGFYAKVYDAFSRSNMWITGDRFMEVLREAAITKNFDIPDININMVTTAIKLYKPGSTSAHSVIIRGIHSELIADASIEPLLALGEFTDVVKLAVDKWTRPRRTLVYVHAMGLGLDDLAEYVRTLL